MLGLEIQIDIWLDVPTQLRPLDQRKSSFKVKHVKQLKSTGGFN